VHPEDEFPLGVVDVNLERLAVDHGLHLSVGGIDDSACRIASPLCELADAHHAFVEFDCHAAVCVHRERTKTRQFTDRPREGRGTVKLVEVIAHKCGGVRIHP
jgi:hypothetical protein